ncbi:hypothetical protein BC830DRAFT_1090570 [Chytriomyces sp. MP71]|nr:hypothetical protein BC830DRAFT_1090570 [Chytriomyces sp. MP71]
MNAGDSSADDSIHVIDFLDEYVKACKDVSIKAIESLTQELQESVDSGTIPKKLKLNGNKPELRFSRIDDAHIKILVRALDSNNFLTFIDLSYNEIGDKGAVDVAGFLRTDTRVRKLVLQSNKIGEQGGSVLAKALVHNETLEEVDLSYNPIGNQGGMEVAAMLQVNETLSKLLIAGCDLSSDALIAIATVIGNTHKMKQLDISNNENHSSRLTQSLANDVMLHLSKMITANHGIDRLAFGKMGVSDFMMTQYLARAILNNRRISRLDLRCNKFTRDGGVALCQSLYKQLYLTHLNLSCCALQDEGAAAVAMMLTHNKTLTHLYLDHNRIAGRGLRDIADAVSIRNRTLVSLRLWGNLWDESACQDWAPIVGGPRMVNQQDAKPAVGQVMQRRVSVSAAEAPKKCRLKPDCVDFCFYLVEKVMHVCENEDTGGNRVFSCAVVP